MIRVTSESIEWTSIPKIHISVENHKDQNFTLVEIRYI